MSEENQIPGITIDLGDDEYFRMDVEKSDESGGHLIPTEKYGEMQVRLMALSPEFHRKIHEYCKEDVELTKRFAPYWEYPRPSLYRRFRRYLSRQSRKIRSIFNFR